MSLSLQILNFKDEAIQDLGNKYRVNALPLGLQFFCSTFILIYPKNKKIKRGIDNYASLITETEFCAKKYYIST